MRGSVVFGATLVLALIAGLAVAATGSSRLIRACVTPGTGEVRIVNGRACKAGERLISWNQEGPQGPEGPEGPEGPAGPQGPAGDSGVPPPPAATDEEIISYLIVPGIPGDGPKGEIEVVDYSHHIAVPTTVGSGGGTSTGAPVHDPLEITKHRDSATSPLLTELTTGATLTELTLRVCQATDNDPHCFLDVELTGAAPLSVDHEIDGTESWTFGYQEISWTYTNLNGFEGTATTYSIGSKMGTVGGAQAPFDLFPGWTTSVSIYENTGSGDADAAGHAGDVEIARIGHGMADGWDPQTGQRTGSVERAPLTIIKTTDPMSPTWLGWLNNGVNVTDLFFDICEPASGGGETCDTVDLDNARFVDVEYGSNQQETWQVSYEEGTWDVSSNVFVDNPSGTSS